MDHFNDASRNIMMLVAFQNTIERLSFNIPAVSIACIFVLLWIFSDKIKSFSFYYETNIEQNEEISHWISLYINSIAIAPNDINKSNYFNRNYYRCNKNKFTIEFKDDIWYKLDDIYIYISLEKIQSKDRQYDKKHMILKSSKKFEIEKFIIKCKKYYDEKHKDSIYYYMSEVQHEITESGKLESKCVWTSYEIITSKTFENLFLEEKSKIVNIIDEFQNKAEIYNFVQHKLGILLKGPAGTGKSSFIKTIAQKLNRNIVNIPIENIKSNEDFFNILFSEKFLLKNEEEGTNYMAKDEIIYVIEDIDRINCALKSEYRQTENNDTESDEFEFDINKRKSKLLNNANKNTLNLAGLLNVIDGVVETPGRIIIFTANHPERLDPALVRPGRIDYIFTFDYIKKKEFIEMITYFKIEVDDKSIDELFSYGPKFTCAYIENEIKNYYINKTNFMDNLIKSAREI